MAISCRWDAKPFDLLELHPVPGRVADHGVEAAGQLRSFPVRPHAGECHLPVQETLTGYQSQGIHQKGKVGIRRISLLPLGDVDLIAEHTIQPLEKRGLDLTLSDAQPVKGVKKRHEGVQGSGHLRDFGEDVGRAVRLGDLGVRQPFDDLHRRGRARGSRERSPQEQAALLLRPADLDDWAAYLAQGTTKDSVATRNHGASSY